MTVLYLKTRADPLSWVIHNVHVMDSSGFIVECNTCYPLGSQQGRAGRILFSDKDRRPALCRLRHFRWFTHDVQVPQLIELVRFIISIYGYEEHQVGLLSID